MKVYKRTDIHVSQRKQLIYLCAFYLGELEWNIAKKDISYVIVFYYFLLNQLKMHLTKNNGYLNTYFSVGQKMQKNRLLAYGM